MKNMGAMFSPPLLAWEQKYADAIAAGCQIVSAATPALSGTYAITDQMVARITAIAAGLAVGKGFPHGAATLDWPDTSGIAHTFTPAQYLDFAAGIEGYVADLIAAEGAEAVGHTATWPAAPVTIA